MKGRFPNLTIAVRNKLKEKFPDNVNNKEEYLFKNKKISFKADVLIRISENKRVFVEIEETQCHPDTNVSKYWMYLDNNKGIKIKLIQFFGRIFGASKNNYRSRVDLCNFIAGKIEKEHSPRFEYFHESLEGYTEEDYKNKSNEIADEIVKIIVEKI